jgi:hypothetical protein
MEDPSPGDFWTYDVHDEITGKVALTRTNVVTEVTPNDVSVRFTVKGNESQGGLNVYDHSWNEKNSSSWKYRPNDGSGIQSPLKTGVSPNIGGEASTRPRALLSKI